MASDNELKWLNMVVAGTDHKEATIECFDVKTPASITSKTSQLKAKFADEVNAALMKEMKQLAPTAFRTIMQLAQTAEQEAVKAKCAMDILDRTGYKPSLQVEDVTKREPQSEAEAMAEVASALKELEAEGVSINTLLEPVKLQKLDVNSHINRCSLNHPSEYLETQ